MRLSLYTKLLPLYIGVAVLIAAPFYSSYKHKIDVKEAALAAQSEIDATKKNIKSTPISGKPVRVVLPELGIDVPVVDGYYVSSKKTWYVAPTSGTFATNTYPINNVKGTSLVYGHWFSYVFGPTKNIKPGYTAYVYTDNHHVFKYDFNSEISVSPTDTAIFSELEGKPTLKIMTCGGTWAQNRRLMTFNLVEAV